MFKSLKGTLQTVQKDISSGLKTISTKSEAVSSHDDSDRQLIFPVDLDAGAEILQRYQNGWEELSSQSEVNEKKAEAVSKSVQKLTSEYKTKVDVFRKFYESVSSLPSIQNQICNLSNQVEHIEELFNQVESTLNKLENACEEIDLQRSVVTHRYMLSNYQQKRVAELDKYRVKLASEHMHVVQDQEKIQHTVLKERETAFQDAFCQDLDFYKTHGHMAKVDITTNSKNVDLSEVEIEQDNSELNTFLGEPSAPENPASLDPADPDHTGRRSPSDPENTGRRSPSDPELPESTDTLDLELPGSENHSHPELPAKREPSDPEILVNGKQDGEVPEPTSITKVQPVDAAQDLSSNEIPVHLSADGNTSAPTENDDLQD